MNKEIKKRIAIIGTGQIGLLFGAHLAAAGYAPVVYGVVEKECREVAAAQLEISGVHELVADVQPVLELVGIFDYILVCTKALANEELAQMLPGHLAEGGLLACMQNGLGVEEPFIRSLGRERVARGVLNLSSMKNGNRLTMSYMTTSYLGVFEKTQPAGLEELAAIIRSAGIAMDTTDKIEDKIWEKILLGVPISVISALTGQNIAQVLDCRPSCQMALAVFDELLQIARSRHFADPENFQATFIAYNVGAGAHIPSLAGDVLRRQVTESRFYSGKALEYARQAQIKAPVLETINHLLMAIDYKNS